MLLITAILMGAGVDVLELYFEGVPLDLRTHPTYLGAMAWNYKDEDNATIGKVISHSDILLFHFWKIPKILLLLIWNTQFNFPSFYWVFRFKFQTSFFRRFYHENVFAWQTSQRMFFGGVKPSRPLGGHRGPFSPTERGRPTMSQVFWMGWNIVILAQCRYLVRFDYKLGFKIIAPFLNGPYSIDGVLFWSFSFLYLKVQLFSFKLT